MNPTHVIYHGNCPDGFAAALSVWLQYPAASYIPALYSQSVPELPRDARVAIVDFSYPREALLALRSHVSELLVLDHHESAVEIHDLDFVCFDADHSGAYLAWEWFSGLVGCPVPPLILYVQDRDLWRWELPDSREISYALRGKPYDFEVWRAFLHDVEPLRTEGKVLLPHVAQMVEVMCKQAWLQDIGGYQVPVANASVYYSEVGERLCELHPDAPFAAYYVDRADGKRQWGLRGRPGRIDVGQVAKRLGGGGHPAAAGFVVPIPGADHA